MSRLLFLCLVLWGNCAFAIGFFTVADISPKPKNLQNISDSLFRIGGGEFRCAAVILSNQGHVATAMHCLNQCIFDLISDEPLLDLTKYERPEFYSAFDLTPGQLIQCKGSFNNINLSSIRMTNELDYLYSMSEPHVVWQGRGKMNHNPAHITELKEEEFSQIKSLTEDVVIVKFDNVGTYEKPKLPCLKIASSAPQDGDQVWNFGYPSGNARTHGRLTKAPMVSQGQVRGSIRQDLVYQNDYSAKLDAEKKELFWQREKALWDREHILLSSADTYTGNSGGAAVNSDGELVGIVFGVTELSDDDYQGASSINFSAQDLRDKVQADLGEAQADEIFNCQ